MTSTHNFPFASTLAGHAGQPPRAKVPTALSSAECRLAQLSRHHCAANQSLTLSLTYAPSLSLSPSSYDIPPHAPPTLPRTSPLPHPAFPGRTPSLLIMLRPRPASLHTKPSALRPSSHTRRFTVGVACSANTWRRRAYAAQKTRRPTAGGMGWVRWEIQVRFPPDLLGARSGPNPQVRKPFTGPDLGQVPSPGPKAPRAT